MFKNGPKKDSIVTQFGENDASILTGRCSKSGPKKTADGTGGLYRDAIWRKWCEGAVSHLHSFCIPRAQEPEFKSWKFPRLIEPWSIWHFILRWEIHLSKRSKLFYECPKLFNLFFFSNKKLFVPVQLTLTIHIFVFLKIYLTLLFLVSNHHLLPLIIPPLKEGCRKTSFIGPAGHDIW